MFSESNWLSDPDSATVGRRAPGQTLSPRLEEIARRFDAKPFVPHRFFRSGHAQTLVASLKIPRRKELGDEQRFYEKRLVEVGPGARVLLECRWQNERRAASTILLIHGLEGSSASLYMRGTARKAFREGFNVACMNMRNCGGTDHLNETLYHSGLTGDIHRVLADELVAREGLPKIFVAGFSMSGNMVLKLAAEYAGEVPNAANEAPGELAGMVAVSPSIDLTGCAERLERRENKIYRWSFMRSLRRRIRTKSRLHPALYDVSGLNGVRTIRQFDERFTAPHGGFRDASDYYEHSSSFRLIGRIKLPTLIIHADDDPLIPVEPFRDASIADNPNVLLLVTRGGGHVGFIADARAGEDRRWAENRVVEFCSLLGREAEDSRQAAGKGSRSKRRETGSG